MWLAIGATVLVVAGVVGVVVVVDDDSPQQRAPVESETGLKPGPTRRSDSQNLPAGLWEALRSQGFPRATKIIDTRCGEYGEVRSHGGSRGQPALARPPDEECFVYILGGGRLQFIRFGHDWSYVPRGVQL
jgi:hypothetical protein